MRINLNRIFTVLFGLAIVFSLAAAPFASTSVHAQYGGGDGVCDETDPNDVDCEEEETPRERIQRLRRELAEIRRQRRELRRQIREARREAQRQRREDRRERQRLLREQRAERRELRRQQRQNR